MRISPGCTAAAGQQPQVLKFGAMLRSLDLRLHDLSHAMNVDAPPGGEAAQPTRGGGLTDWSMAGLTKVRPAMAE